MKKKLCLILSLTACYVAESAPAGLGLLEYDNLDTDLSKLRYVVEKGNLKDFSKVLDDTQLFDNNKDAKTRATLSGFKKKNTEDKGIKYKNDNVDLKKFFNIAAANDKGFYDDNGVYAVVKGIASKAIGVDGFENRKYKKGSKTRGFHRVQHKDEYEKDKTFYEDDEIEGAIKKVGAKAIGDKFAAGAGFKHGNYNHNGQKGIYGKQGYLDTGYFDKEFSGFSDSQGFDGSYKKEV